MVSFYEGFVDLSYRPSKEDLVCSFYVEPERGLSMKTAAGAVAGESSVGTWTKLTTMTKRIMDIGAVCYEIRGNWIKIAYPSILWEPGNMPQIYSGIAGNVFGMKAVKNLRLEHIRWPPKLLRSFRGPELGIGGIRKLFDVKDRPLTASVPKPKIGMSTAEHAHVAYETWMGGFDLVKDDENLTDQTFNRFDARIKATMAMRDKAEKETGEKKSYLVNITSETKEMLRRMKLAHDQGNEYAMVDIVTCGWAGLQTAREAAHDLGMAIHAHRAMHAAFSRNPLHGVSMLSLAVSARAVGVDQLHIGTVVGKLESPKEEVLALQRYITGKRVKGSGKHLDQDWLTTKPVLPTASGGLHPGILPPLIDILGKDIVIQVGGGVHGFPQGTRAGCVAVRQAIDAAIHGVPLKEAARRHKELRTAIELWGTQPFR